jgi:copper chaperone CopZ
MKPQRHPSFARSAAWGLASGLAASLCCLGPSAAALLGLGASSLLAGAQLGVGAAAALGLATLVAGAALAVRSGARCGLGPARRLRAPLVMVAVFALSYALLGRALPLAAARQIAAATPAPAEAPVVAAAPPARRLALSIEKMDCLPCVVTVRRLLAEQPGVAAFTAELELDVVTVEYRPAVVDAETLIALIPDSYGLTVIGDTALP